MSRSLVCALALLLCLGCEEDAGADAGFDAGPPDAGSDAGVDASGPSCAATSGEVVTFATDDGVNLEADLYVPDAPSGDAVILFHMIPPSNDRSNYPAAFISALTDRGLVVLNVDRRGAGGSGGDAMQAYTGPNGKLDVKAAIDFLDSHACAPSRFVLVGASNGTTSVLDYTVFAATDASPSPAAIVFLTGGGYTEAQNRIAEQRSVLDPLPLLFLYSTDEAAWSAGQMPGSASWTFDERTGGDHGTVMFTAVPATIEAVATWIDEATP